MRFVSFIDQGSPTLGVKTTDGIVQLNRVSSELPTDLKSLLEGGDAAIAQVQSAVSGAPATATRDAASIEYAIPLANPGKIICLGLNYADHAKEGGHDKPDYPSFFMRGPTSLVAHGDAIEKPSFSDTMDYEAELMVIVGKRCRNVSEADALSVVAGYSCFNDGSVREYQRKTSQWTIGKNFDKTGGFGPEFVTPDELPEGCAGLAIKTRVNGKTMQDANTNDMLFDVRETIALLTACMTLETGDLIAMGTPSGVGHARKPPAFMNHGDICEIDIEGVGVLKNEIVELPAV